MNTLNENLEHYLVTEEVQEHKDQAAIMVDKGVPQALADNIARLSSLYSAMDIAQIAKELKQEIDHISRIYFVLGAELSLHWFLQQVNNQSVDNHWQALARASFREDLDWQQRQLTSAVITAMVDGSTPEQGIEAWMQEHDKAILRWESVLAEFKVGNVHEFAKFSVALRELMLLNLNCRSSI